MSPAVAALCDASCLRIWLGRWTSFASIDPRKTAGLTRNQPLTTSHVSLLTGPPPPLARRALPPIRASHGHFI
jgi:hypothetical protein